MRSGVVCALVALVAAAGACDRGAGQGGAVDLAGVGPDPVVDLSTVEGADLGGARRDLAGLDLAGLDLAGADVSSSTPDLGAPSPDLSARYLSAGAYPDGILKSD